MALKMSAFKSNDSNPVKVLQLVTKLHVHYTKKICSGRHFYQARTLNFFKKA